MAAFNTQKVLSVHHWTDAYFTFTCTRDESLRFENGQFVMVGLMVDGKPLMRAYKHLYLLSTGTGIAPFLSITKDPEIYEQFEKIILVHGVRYKKDLAYYDRFTKELPEHEYLGDLVKEKLIYYPIVSREDYEHHGRLTDLMVSGKLFEDIGLPKINPQDDRAMLCGSPAMLKDTCKVLDDFGLTVSPKTGVRGDYLIERAFVDQ